MVSINNTPTQTPVALNPNNPQMNFTDSTPNPSSDYEKCREQRIKENLERMQKLGIYDLSLKMKSIKPNCYRKNNKPFSANQNKTPNRCVSPLPSSVPTRRSSRLQSTPAISYAEVVLSKKSEDGDRLMAKNSNPEVYTEEHEKLLGDTKTEWTLFVDGYGKDGKRIYDPVRGKTCHQCRQKTLGHRTHCIQCNMVQGQFCGDCLYMRYGENVLEAKQNPDWICPVCRGICNCSLCRQAKGWAPTGTLYRKISSQGYKSVAHYLIQTHQPDSNLETNEKTDDTQVCAKRSLPFSKEESESKDVSAKTENIESKHKNLESEVNADEKVTDMQSSEKSLCNNVKAEISNKVNESEVKLELTNVENRVNYTDDKVKTVMLTPEISEGENVESRVNNTDDKVKTVMLTPEISEGENVESKVNNTDDKVKTARLTPEISEGENVENKINNTNDEVKTVMLTPETKPGSRKRRVTVVLEDSIARRLRSRRP